MTSDAALPADYLEFRAAFPDANFIEFLDGASVQFDPDFSPAFDMHPFAIEPDGEPYVFIDGQVALISRWDADDAEWVAPSFRAFAVEMLAVAAAYEDEDIEEYAAYFTDERWRSCVGCLLRRRFDEVELSTWERAGETFRWAQ